MGAQSIVIDNGTSFTKIGYSGNIEPDFVIPTVISNINNKNKSNISSKADEFNFSIGDEAINLLKESKTDKLIYPMRDGLIDNWDLMEKFWFKSIYDYLNCDPEAHYFVISEPSLNPPKNRENMAEIFFETFNVPGLYICDQARFAVYGIERFSEYFISGDPIQEKAIKSFTGLVINLGDGMTQIVPICQEYPVESNIIKQFPITGKSINTFIRQMLKERGENIQTPDLPYAIMDLKEKYGYLSRDIIEEISKFDKKKNENGKLSQSHKFKKMEGVGRISNKQYSINLGYELFLGPESYFSPEIIDKNFKESIEEIIDLTIQQCPIEYRKLLYSNIILTGGNGFFLNFDKKLEISLQDKVNKRLRKYNFEKQDSIKVNVKNGGPSKYLEWLGGSSISSQESFKSFAHTRQEYLEKGSSCFRDKEYFMSEKI